LVDEQVVPVTYDEVKKLNEKLFTDYPSFSDKAMVSKITNNSVDKDAVAKEIRTVNKVFNQRAMLAASGLLLKIMRQFDGLYEKKQFYLVKNGQVGWISAYVNESIDK